MIDPNDYLHVQLVIGSKRVEVVNRNGKVLLTSTGGSDGNAIKKLGNLIDAILEDRKAALCLPA